LLVFFEDTPLIQIFPLILYNAGLVYYLSKEATFEDPYLHIINQVKEILILLGELFIVALNFQYNSEHHYNILGWLITSCFCLALLIEVIYIIALQVIGFKKLKGKIVALGRTIYSWIKNRKSRKRQKYHKSRRIFTETPSEELMTLEVEMERNEERRR